MWKISHITPIYKRSGSKSCKTSYRPISLLPTISKCFESVMHDRLKNNKISSTPPIIENEHIINDPKEKSNVFNNYFASKSRVPNFDDPVPHLPIRDGLNKLNMLNTSPIEVAKIIRVV